MMHPWPVAIGFVILTGALPEHASAADPMCAYGPQRFLEPATPLHGEWRCARAELDADLSLSERGPETIGKLRLEGGGFEQPGFDDHRWQRVRAPGLVVSPPEPLTGGLLYRTRFAARSPEDGERALLRFEGAGAIADVWLNGEWVGGHEGEYTPFTLDVTERIREWNTLAVRVHIIPWGTREDTVPYANCDFWQYGGILRDVCLAWAPAAHVTSLRPLTSPDGFDARVAVRNAADRQALAAVVVEAFGPFVPGAPEVRGPVPDLSGHQPIARSRAGIRLAAGEWREVAIDVAIPEPQPWSPDSPTLYVVRARLGSDELAVATGWRTLRAEGGRLLLNGAPTRIWGVARHEELPETWRACPWADWGRVYEDLARIRDLGCTFLRAGHYPNHPMVAMICDRLGLALWEEIPIYWFGGPQLLMALERGVAQAMWLEMIHRDGASPSLWFLGAMNETGWHDERVRFITELRRLAYEVDGTRLVGQAAVGQGGDDATQEVCDFVGMTCYHGVFYSQQEGAYEGTRRGLRQAAEAFPDKPIIVAEFGSWAEGEDGEVWQRGILTDTLRAMRENPQVAGATWWTAYDYASPHQQGHPPWHYFGLWNWERDVLRPSGQAYGEALAEE
jgi:beta-galactosidase/beta-glucuronidase